jgi:PAS domain S-box-containing protein
VSWISRLRPWQFFMMAVLLSEGLVCIMSLLMRGTIAPDYLITGLVVSSAVASIVIYFVNKSNRLQFENDILLERQKFQEDLQKIFELSADLICTASMTHFLKINPAGERILGYSQEELRDIPFMDLIHPDDIEPTGKVIEHELKKGKSVLRFVNRYRNRDGNYRWLEWMTHPVSDEGMLYAVARDITERRKAEEALKESEERYRALFTNEVDAISIFEIETRKIIDVNDAYLKMYGYTREDVLKLTTDDISAEVEVTKEAIKKSSISGTVFIPERRHRKKDGTVIYVDLSAGPFIWKGRKLMYAIVRDITERKKADERLSLQAQMIDLLKDSLVSTDMDGFVKTWSRGAEALHGYTAFEAIGKHVSFVLPPEEHDHLQETIKRLKENTQYETEFKMLKKSGEFLYAILSTSMIYDEKGTPTGMLGYAIDVTQRKQMEEDLRHALEDKDVLMREIHHRTKNNMAVIQSLLSLQSGQVKDKDALSSLNESAYRVKTLSMIHESLYSTGDLSSINIKEYLQSLSTDLFQGFGIEPSRIELNMDVPDIQMDVDQVVPVGLIVNELLTNALKYAFPEGRGGDVFVELQENVDKTFTLTVADSGIGLPEDFDITKAETLGLRLVSSLSAQIRGRLNVSGDKGSTFRITFKKSAEDF